jgi:hypothetical protein
MSHGRLEGPHQREPRLVPHLRGWRANRLRIPVAGSRESKKRIVALGASNLTRGFQTVVRLGRQVWGEDLEVMGALGHGRSYGMDSRILGRTLPGILQCGLWRELSNLPRANTRALVTDIGNDILYGATVPDILGWVEECIDRLKSVGARVTLTDLPLVSIRRVSAARFFFFRSVLVPSCRLSFQEVVGASQELAEGLEMMATRLGVTWFQLRPEWYGFDPIHMRPSSWARAWTEILLAGELDQGTDYPTQASGGWVEGVRLYLAPPEKRWLFGVQQTHKQPVLSLRGGSNLWMF